MKKVCLILTLAMTFIFPMVLSGCGTKEKAPDTKAVAPEKKDAASAEKPAAEHPATDKPKDHPAH